MTTRTTALLAVALLVTPLAAGSTHTQASSNETALRMFRSAVHGYVDLHRRLEDTLPPLRQTDRAQDIFDASEALAAAIQRARAGAREGDVVDPAAGAFMRKRIADTLAARGVLPEELIGVNLEEADPRAAQPVVNGRFPWARAAGMWPCVLQALPQLPKELEYRMVGGDLVLIDVHANLVVDVLRDAVQ
jgi:hypothetical protein